MLIGHLTRDLACGRSGPGRVGGTALYAAIAARRLGRRLAIVTACGPDLQLPAPLRDGPMIRVSGEMTTTFEVCQEQGRRTLALRARATDIQATDVPSIWRQASIVHLAPVAAELPPSIFTCLGDGMAVATLQGWLRAAAPDGTVVPVAEGLQQFPLERLSAAVLSAEDLGLRGATAARVDELLGEVCSRVPVVALTRGARGSTLFVNGCVEEIPAYKADVVDTTGAGDVYAAALFIRLAETANPVESARFAACAAAISVEGHGWSRIPDRRQVEQRLRGAAWGA